MTKEENRIIVEKDKRYTLNIKNISPPHYLISYTVCEIDDIILNKIYSAKSIKLPENTKFALGIVTGNNKKYIHEERGENEEPIFRGKDIVPYRLKQPQTFIKFTPEIFQQVAPVLLYRTQKIVYKFISDNSCCRDVMLWFAVYRNCVKYWVLKSDDVYKLNFSPQHRNSETAIRKHNYKKTDIYEGQVMITRDNIDSIQEFQVEGRALRQAIIEKYLEANPSKWDFLSDCENLIPQT